MPPPPSTLKNALPPHAMRSLMVQVPLLGPLHFGKCTCCHNKQHLIHFMSNQKYTEREKIFRQTFGGSIGPDLTRLVSRVLIITLFNLGLSGSSAKSDFNYIHSACFYPGLSVLLCVTFCSFKIKQATPLHFTTQNV